MSSSDGCVETVLVGVLGHGLPARTRTSPGADGWPSAPLGDRDWAQLVSLAARHRVTGLLLAAVLDGVLPVTDQQQATIVDHHIGVMATAVRLDRQLTRVVRLLREAAIEVVVLKGPAVAHLDYGDRSHRAYGDVDVLVRGRDVDATYDRLRDAGWDRPAARLGPDFDRRFGKGATFVGPDGFELDVHRTFVFGAFGVPVDTEELFEQATPFEVGGTKVVALAGPHRYLHACYHAALGNPEPRWSTLRDVLQMHRVDHERSSAVLAAATRWGGTAVVQRAHRLVHEQLGIELEGPVAAAVAAYEPTLRDRMVLDTYVGRRRSFAAQVLAMVPALDTWGERAALVRSVVAPEAASIRARGTRGRLAWLRRGLRSLRRRADR